jgi:hypothetical protein
MNLVRIHAQLGKRLLRPVGIETCRRGPNRERAAAAMDSALTSK